MFLAGVLTILGRNERACKAVPSFEILTAGRVRSVSGSSSYSPSTVKRELLH